MYCTFDYLQPDSLHTLYDAMDSRGEQLRLYAGGTDLLVLLRARKISCAALADVKMIPDLHGICEKEDTISIGAASSFSDIADHPLIAKYAPALSAAARKVGSTQIRFKGTIGGNIMNASPAGDGLCACYGLNSSVELASRSGIRRMPITSFLLAPRKTAIAPGEVLTRIYIPKNAFPLQQFFKVGRRNALAISVVNGTVGLKISSGVVQQASVVLGAVAPTPVHIQAAEACLTGQSLSMPLLHKIESLVQEGICPISDIRASAEYRSYIAGVMVRRQLETIWKEVQ